MNYFAKEIVGNSILFQGAKIPFEVLAENTGVIALDDAKEADKKLIAYLTSIAGTRGVYAISAETYAQKKRQLVWRPSKPNSVLAEIRPVAHPRRGNPADLGLVPPAVDSRAVADQINQNVLAANPETPTPASTPTNGTAQQPFVPATRRVRRNPAADLLKPQ